MAPLFVVSAILSGTALVTLLALASERWPFQPAGSDKKLAARLYHRRPDHRPVLRRL